jgi:ankyrin repeat protein
MEMSKWSMLCFRQERVQMLMVSVLILITVIIDNMKLGAQYGTVLCAACANGNVEVVNALLQAGARRNGNGE